MKKAAVVVAMLVMFWVVFLNQSDELEVQDSLTPAQVVESETPRPLAKLPSTGKERVAQEELVESPDIKLAGSSKTQDTAVPTAAQTEADPDGSWVDVLVLDSKRQPVAGVDLVLSALQGNSIGALMGEPASQSGKKAKTDEFGSARIETEELGFLRITARAKEFAPNASDVFRLTKVNPNTSVEVQVTRGGSIAGQLLDIHGDPAGKTRISVHLSAWPDRKRVRTTGVMQLLDTKDDGSFLFTLLTPGEYNLYTHAKGEDLERVPAKSLKLLVIDGQTTHVEFEDLTGSYVQLSGIVLRNDVPASFARINFAWADRSRGFIRKRTKTDEDGRFKITLDEGGEYRLQISSKVFTGSVFQEVSIPNETSHEIEVRINTGGIRGHVFGPDGSPVPNFKLSAFGKHGEGNGSSIYNATTDESGQYRLTEVIAATYRIKSANSMPSRRPTLSAELPYLGSGETGDFGVTQGATIHDADLRLAAAGAISVTIIDRDGNPVDNAEVHIRSTDDLMRAAMPTNGLTGEEGVYVGGGLPDGEYGVSAILGNLVTQSVLVATKVNTTESIELILEAGITIECTAFLEGDQSGVLSVRMMNSDGQAVAMGYSSGATCRVGPVLQGTYTITGSMMYEGEILQDKQTLTVSGSEPISIEFDLK
ncbi:MAG: hypothetical protein ACI8X5_004096 [Planctomycetota bacterium]|jgi:hypothetical protein